MSNPIDDDRWPPLLAKARERKRQRQQAKLGLAALKSITRCLICGGAAVVAKGIFQPNEPWLFSSRPPTPGKCRTYFYGVCATCFALDDRDERIDRAIAQADGGSVMKTEDHDGASQALGNIGLPGCAPAPAPGEPVEYPEDPALRICFLCERPGLPAFWDPAEGDADLVGAPRNKDGVPGRLHLFLCFSCATRAGTYQRIRNKLLEARQ